jgi:hypothetical protein
MTMGRARGIRDVGAREHIADVKALLQAHLIELLEGYQAK